MESVSKCISTTFNAVCSKEFFTSENVLFAVPVVGDLYMIARTLFDNIHGFKEKLPFQPVVNLVFHDSEIAQGHYTELAETNALRACHYTLAKVAGYVVFSFFALLPVLGTFIAGIVSTSSLLFVGVMVLNTALITTNIEKRKNFDKA
jgi:hypothetical protein